jgi:hypothetical protein
MRGEQETDKQGSVTFSTVMPGWYWGRPVHVHVKVFLPAGGNFTTQLYFSQEMLATVAKLPAYKLRRSPTKQTSSLDIQLSKDHAMMSLLTLVVVFDQNDACFKSNYVICLDTCVVTKAVACRPRNTA